MTMRAGLLLLACVACVLGFLASAAPGMAQDARLSATQFVTLDRDRLFQGTQFGRRVIEHLASERLRLVEETQELEAALEAEELALTEARKTLTPEAFRAKADAFDEKVVALRAEAEEASARFAALRTTEQRQFEERVVDILNQLLIDLGAVAILDRSAILLSARNIDITDLAIARIDAAIGDGSTPAVGGGEDAGDAAPEPQPQPPATDGTEDGTDPASDPAADPTSDN